MKRILTSSSLCLFLCLFLLVPMITKAQRAPVAASVPGEFIVKYKSSTSSIHSQRSKLAMKADIHKAFTNMGMYHIAMKAGPGEAAQLQDIKNDPDVEFVEPNYIWNKSEVAAGNIALNTYTYNQVLHFNRANPDNDFYQNDLNTGVRESWTHSASLATNPHKVVVAIVDTGLDSSHTLFKPVDQGGSGALWINNAEATGRAGIDDDQNGYVDDISGWNFITNSPNFDDDD
ncbi:MAG TPA: hypothetical protein VN132_06675, partial [Bdellovibrio sp.]|nr:hypothetical protein [Bdellovibrio sp.]